MTRTSPDIYSSATSDVYSSATSIDDDDECVVDDLAIALEDLPMGGGNINDSDVENQSDVEGDEEDQYVHDQLPSVEEVKTSEEYQPTAKLIAAKNNRNRFIGIAFGALAVIGMIAFAVNAGGSSSSSTSSKSTSSDKLLHETHERYDDVVNFLFANKITSLPALEYGTAEHYAALFMAEGDAYHMDPVPENERKFVERYVLALLYYATNGNNWKHHYHFLSGRDHCDWKEIIKTPAGTFTKGIECNEEGFVTGLDLSNNNLINDRIPPEIMHLTQLEKLHLHHNDFGGNFPKIETMTKIKSIGLMNTGIRGTIPDFVGEFVQLTTLALSNNNLHSSIPDSLKNLVSLRILGLDGNNLSGNINTVKGLNALEALYLEDNQLTGELKGNVWSHMKELDMSGNMFFGTIPKNLLHSPSLKVLDLHMNFFEGDFPQDITSNDSLEYLAMNNNQLKGELSDRIGYLANLQHLHVGSNLLTGTIPDTIGQLTNLVTLSTSGNKFSKQRIQDFYSKMKNLKDLSMKGNNFTGSLPNFFGEMSSLQLLDLDGNDLSGSIPTWYGLMTNLHALMLNRNELTGTIPDALTKLNGLKILLLDGNNLTGSAKNVCQSPMGLKLDHFVTDCYPGKNGVDPAEVDCRCCTLCCNDSDPDCNNHSWENESFTKFKSIGYIGADYNFNLDQAPEGWSKKAKEEALATAPAASGSK